MRPEQYKSYLRVLIIWFVFIILMMILFTAYGCDSQVVYDDVPIEKNWGKQQEAVDTFISEPYGDCFCKETVKVRSWNYNVERLEQIHVTPVGCTTPHGWYLTYHFMFSMNTTLLYEMKVECKAEQEWDNYWDRRWIYDNEWFNCDYYVPYPFPAGASHSDYNGEFNCIKQ
jgi:hypothetical protein